MARHRFRMAALISQGFWLAETACTQELWQVVTGYNPSHFKTSPQHPVDSVSWDDCQVFMLTQASKRGTASVGSIFHQHM